MSFINELNELSQKSNKSELEIEIFKKKLRAKAEQGERKGNFSEKFYNKDVIKWLRSEGFDVIEIDDQRDGNYIMVSW